MPKQNTQNTSAVKNSPVAGVSGVAHCGLAKLLRSFQLFESSVTASASTAVATCVPLKQFEVHVAAELFQFPWT